jgi:NAD(P)-dependent dehydrogenase (short-subunit alcohol dehydrogenase family)
MRRAFEDRTAIVTGAATGLGEGIAEGLFARGANLVLADIDGDGAQVVANRLDPSGTRTLAVQTDVADPRSVAAMVDVAVERFDALDYAVNNAGITGAHDVPLAETDVEAWRQVLDINLSGIFLCMKYEILKMLGRGGVIVNMSSGAGAVGQAGSAPYCASKHGIVGLTRAAALDYADKKIRINAIGPSFIDTPLMRQVPEAARAAFVAKIPMGRLGTRTEVADMTAFLLSDEASFLTGGFYLIDGGQTAG